MERMEQIKLEVEAAKQAGFSNEEIKSSYSDEINAAKQNGFSDDQINATYGLRKPDPKIVQEYVSKITKDYLSEEIVSPEDEMLYQSRIKQAILLRCPCLGLLEYRSLGRSVKYPNLEVYSR